MGHSLSMGCHNVSELQDLGCSNQLLLQPLWDRIRTGEASARSPFFPVIFSIFTYLGFCLPFVVLDVLCPWVPILRRYKIHPDFSPSVRQLLPCLGLTLYQHLVFVFPVTLMHWARSPALLPREAPELSQLLSHVLICLLLFDTEIFAWHLLHHKVPWLYRTFHKVHHQNSSSFALATQYMSVWELLSLPVFVIWIEFNPMPGVEQGEDLEVHIPFISIKGYEQLRLCPKFIECSDEGPQAFAWHLKCP